MSFWTTEKGSEPKRNYRFKVQFPGFQANQGASGPAGTDIVWWAKKVTKPAFTVGETTHKLLNHTFHFPSTVTWETVTLTMVDPINPSTTNLMLNLLQTAGYKLPGQTLSEGTVNKALMGVALGTVSIIHLDADGSALETWSLKNAFIKSVKFSDLDYDSEDLSTCDLELRYDWAELVTAAGTTKVTGTETPAGPAQTWNWGAPSTAETE
tara:strand:- start:21424 stop:22053 length:630 start_codon:yes stop_codon:yes gene_type:complete